MAPSAVALIDLSAVDVFDKLLRAVGSREIGLYTGCNAGSDQNGSYFLDGSIDTWLGFLSRNLLTLDFLNYTSFDINIF
ncbi:MAG: hypothetical protein GVY19_00540 [Bacteroidetes bacterium]|jgi:hypothetical protein|nr:hypothetical protein [Bacteroidota bacterium]